MYLPSIHAEEHIPSLREFIRANPLGILTTAIDSQTYPTIQSSHIPFILDIKDENDEAELGTLRGHMARANPQTKAMIENVTEGPSKETLPRLEKEVMVLFNGPVQHYVTPKFYKETKPATGKTVPTWDYSAVQVYGKATIFFDSKDPATDVFLSKQLSDLSLFGETQIMGYDKPWQTSDAPTAYIDLRKKAIIGIQIDVERMGGKWKMNQESGEGDREGVIEGFQALGTEVGDAMAKCVKERAEIAAAKKRAAS
ncbi:uncharacterized protein K452DRAFT_286774 [Aplosporella prunicola CBS 121167]|uniref:Transcriptional regulator n=1 Tax=Aplosporella prunicola CBS 121167 TaxID=1176127 RepID=A0A6A6BE46_9PEZI|nr:uncharacterized protein K452DRAFT_286774 [Aplosporella prunicola CBS 121167]KAF2142346.1 hypothetical protein K452DRAFT_286774 [Aplosporella prunicola CBS 121167]